MLRHSTPADKLKVITLFLTLLIICLLGALITITIIKIKDKDNNDDICLSEECINSAASLSSSMDFRVDPCVDFYQYACGYWQRDHPYPAYIEVWSQFYKLQFGIRDDLIKLLNDNNTLHIRPPVMQKLFNFYYGCIDKETRSKSDYRHLKKLITRIGGWPMVDPQWTDKGYDWENYIVEIIKMRQILIISIDVVDDLWDNNMSIIQIGPPYPKDQVYALANDNDENSDDCKQKDPNEPIKMAARELMNDPHLDVSLFDAQIKNYTEFHKQLIKLLSPINSESYYQKHYDSHKITVKDMMKKFPDINWRNILRRIFPVNVTIDDDTKVFVPDFHYLENVGKIIKNTAPRTIANYISTFLVFNFGKFTTIKMMDIMGDKLSAPEVLSNLCYNHAEKFLPNLLGRLYIDNYFNRDSFEHMKSLIVLLKEAFNKQLDENQWMDPHTKEAAKSKLNAMTNNVAFPEWIIDDEKLTKFYEEFGDLKFNEFFSSVYRIQKVSQIKNFRELSSMVSDGIDIGKWASHNAIEVNAFYYFPKNGIYFPAGIAQFPFYQYNRPMSMNLGAIGMIIGHEMTHGFDTKGSYYDKNGNLVNWWTDETRKLFDNKSNCFINQYDKFHFSDLNKSVSGENTLSENIADNGGLREAFRAFQLYKSRHREKLQKLPGKMSQFSDEQIFFLSFANMWCSHMTPKVLKDRLNEEPHSPDNVRVIESLANFNHFANAFNCPIGSRMNPGPKDQCILW